MHGDAGDYSGIGEGVSEGKESDYDANAEFSEDRNSATDVNTEISESKIDSDDIADVNTELSESASNAEVELSEVDESTELCEDEIEGNDTQERLTDGEKTDLKAETSWSDEVVDFIASKDEAEIYKKAGLREEVVDGKACLVSDAIDMEQKDEFGRTNRVRIQERLSPINKNGETVELHHIGQKADSPLAELTTAEHRQNGNDSVLHNKAKDSEIDRGAFTTEKQRHWKSRARQL